MPPPIPSYNFKQGATFSLGGFASLPTGSGYFWEATAELRDGNGVLISELQVTLQAPTAPDTKWALLLYQDATETATWPLGPLYCDIRFVNSGTVLPTATFVVNIVQRVTTSQPTLML